jgi:hypothetical protein
MNEDTALFDLYKPWWEENDIGLSRIDLEKVAAWIRERAE